MKWLATLPGLLLISGMVSGQACIPNNDTVSGIEPDTLAPVYVGIPYEETIYFRLPADTVVDLDLGGTVIYDVHLCIDSLTIDSVVGLPAGFGYACNVPWCSVKGGDNGCAKISGTATPDQAGTYPLLVFVTVYVNDCYGFPLPGQVDTVTFFFLQVMGAQQADAPVSAGHALGLLFPNPGRDEVVAPVQLTQGAMVELRITDLQGRTVYLRRDHLSAGGHHLRLRHGLPAGSYVLELTTEGYRQRRPMVVAD